MTSLVLNNYQDNTDDRMKTEYGDISCPIWLLVNPKYPADIYNIWAPIMYEMQDQVYRKLHARIDRRRIFIKNAVSDIGIIPNNLVETEAAREVVMLRESVLEYQPKFVITFGTISHEFVRRVFDLRSENGPKYWRTSNLRNEFERSIADFDITKTNWLPVTRLVSKTGRIIKDWEDGENFYKGVATKIVDRIIEHKDSLKIWI